MSGANEYLASLEGQRIEGGCEHCDAYQVVERTESWLWGLTVYHDDDCPRVNR